MNIEFSSSTTGETREHGKTSALKAGLSVWGNPEDLTLTFNTTMVGIERLAGFFNDLPLGLDEKSINNSQANIEKLIYMIANGISRIRGNKTGGVQEINTWRTIVLSTGEETISTNNTRTGVQTRTLEIEGSPYDYDEDKASSMYKIVSRQFGTAGPLFLEKLIEEYGQDDFKGLKEKFQNVLERVSGMTNNDVSSYISAVSVVTLSDILIGKWLFNEDEETSYKMAKKILENLESAKEIDIIEKQYQSLISWIIGRHNLFDTYKKNLTAAEKTILKINREDDLVETDRTKISYGVYDNGVYYVLRHIIEEKLGPMYTKTIKEFAKRKLIIPTLDEEGNIVTTTVQKKIRGINARCFAFSVEMMEKELSEEEKTREWENYQAQSLGYKDSESRDKVEKQLMEGLFT